MRTAILSCFFVVASLAQAQDERQSASMYLSPQAKADVSLYFSVDAQGKRYEPTWGLDLAWIDEQNLRKGVRHMGAENVGIGRSAFRATEALTNDTGLGNDQISKLRQRSNLFNTVCGATLPLVLTADQEAANTEAQKAGDYYVKNKSCNTSHWAAMINAHVKWMQQNTSHPIVGVSPFNEPDYWTAEEGATVAKQVEVAKMLRENYSSTMSDVAIVGGNTLNDDKAISWYETGTQYYDWGNTHQLAGSFANFAAFYERLKTDGKVGYGDEMHNVGEAMVGLKYGMTVGIWWGFDSRARGEFCDISRHGEELAYGEHRDNWTAASVYRHDDGRVKAFFGSSERQAKTTNYQLVSRDRDVYYDTRGPLREFVMEVPGGTGYQVGQTNAERVVDITWGEDVPPCAIEEGIYRMINKATTTVVIPSSGKIMMQKSSKAKIQQWYFRPVDTRIGGDFSFYEIESANTAHMHINVKNFSTLDGAEVIAYSTNTKPDSNEQWYLQYAGNGYYYIRNRETSLYLTTKTASTSNGVVVQTNELQADETERERQMWRILPAGVDYDTQAPAQPQGLKVQELPASVKLSWQANSEADLAGYTILRAEQGSDEWNTIARGVVKNYFVDNNISPARTYIYKVKALDKAMNLSEASETVTAAATREPAMIACWSMDSTFNDATSNMMDAALYGDTVFIAGHEDGKVGLNLNAKRYLQLPYEVADNDEMTITMWVNWRSSTAWQRIFDFGNGTDQYLFLTPSNGSTMRLAIKDGGDEQILDCPSKLAFNKWKHVAVTMGNDRTAIYIDGEEVASTTSITIRPSDIRPALNYLGRSQFTADPFFVGIVEDVRIFNYALSAEQVKRTMTSIKMGDVNDDGAVDVADIASVLSVMAGISTGSVSERADVNGDGVVDVADIAKILSIMAGNGE